jgi:hypothetical protein
MPSGAMTSTHSPQVSPLTRHNRPFCDIGYPSKVTTSHLSLPTVVLAQNTPHGSHRLLTPINLPKGDP